LKTSKSLYKIGINKEQTNLQLICLANIITYEQKNITYIYILYIDSEDIVNTLKQKYTLFFKCNYYKFKNQPLVLFKTKELKNKFAANIQKLNIGSFYMLDLETNDDFINTEINDDIFEEWSNKTHIKDFLYFISSTNNNEFNKWGNKLSQEKRHNITQNLYLLNQLTKIKQEYNRLIAENILLKESLLVVKQEYNKELNWYKSEIEKIKTWYQKEFENTPKIITKLFKKLSLHL